MKSAWTTGGACMPALEWSEILDVYYRPHLLIVNLRASTDSAAGKRLLKLLRRLIESLHSTADYAFLPEEYEVKIAFEQGVDFEVVRGLLKATLLEVGGDEWTARSICMWEP